MHGEVLVWIFKGYLKREIEEKEAKRILER